MIYWLNGPFGAGKTTVSRLLLAADPSLVLFDTETVGYLLRPVLQERVPVGDFQDWSAWRTLTVAALVALDHELGAHGDADLLVPQTVLVQQYWNEMSHALAARGLQVRAFTLDVEQQEHRRRIDDDVQEIAATEWRRQRRSDYDNARAWLAESTELIDTTHSTPAQVAALIRSRIIANRE